MKKSARRKKGTFFEKMPEKKVAVSLESPNQPATKSPFFKTPFGIGTVIVLLVVVAAVIVYFFAATREDVGLPNTSNLNDAQLQQLVDEVSNLMVIPVGEVPVMALVSDASRLKEQPFFKNAENGDRVLIFKSTRQAILYRSSVKKIIAATTISESELKAFEAMTQNTNPQASESAEITPPAQKIKTVVLNSTKEAGLAKKGGNLLDEKVYDVISLANSQGEYETTTVVNVSKEPYVTQAVLNGIVSSFSKIKASVGSLPIDEASPAGADIVIILGRDFSEMY